MRQSGGTRRTRRNLLLLLLLATLFGGLAYGVRCVHAAPVFIFPEKWTGRVAPCPPGEDATPLFQDALFADSRFVSDPDNTVFSAGRA